MVILLSRLNCPSSQKYCNKYCQYELSCPWTGVKILAFLKIWGLYSLYLLLFLEQLSLTSTSVSTLGFTRLVYLYACCCLPLVNKLLLEVYWHQWYHCHFDQASTCHSWLLVFYKQAGKIFETSIAGCEELLKITFKIGKARSFPIRIQLVNIRCDWKAEN